MSCPDDVPMNTFPSAIVGGSHLPKDGKSVSHSGCSVSALNAYRRPGKALISGTSMSDAGKVAHRTPLPAAFPFADSDIMPPGIVFGSALMVPCLEFGSMNRRVDVLNWNWRKTSFSPHTYRYPKLGCGPRQ